MKVAIPKDNTEIVTCIMSLFDEMVRLKDDIHNCKKAIVDHAEEARESNSAMNATVTELKFSVTNLQANMVRVQKALETLTELSTSLVTIGNFLVKVAKIVTWVCGILLAFKGLTKLFG